MRQQTLKPKPTRSEIERAARRYRTSTEASQSLGIPFSEFVLLCAWYEIETPGERKQRKKMR